MGNERGDRRDFLKSSLATAGTVWVASGRPQRAVAAQEPARAPRLRFAAIGLNHGHIYGHVEAVARGGGELVSFFAKEPELVAAFAERFPQARSPAASGRSSRIPPSSWWSAPGFPNERAPLGVEVMRHGKDYMVDKPGITTLEQLAEVRRVQAETRRIYSICYSERLREPGDGEGRRAGEGRRDRQGGADDRPRAAPDERRKPRPAWFFERERYGGILCDIASHQFDQFLFFTGSTQAEVVASQVGNFHHPQYPGWRTSAT